MVNIIAIQPLHNLINSLLCYRCTNNFEKSIIWHTKQNFSIITITLQSNLLPATHLSLARHLDNQRNRNRATLNSPTYLTCRVQLLRVYNPHPYSARLTPRACAIGTPTTRGKKVSAVLRVPNRRVFASTFYAAAASKRLYRYAIPL